MAERHQNPAAETIPGTPVIREVRTGSRSDKFKPVSTRIGGLRAEIDISPPFKLVPEAVTGFGGRGVPFSYVSSLLISDLNCRFISCSSVSLKILKCDLVTTIQLLKTQY